MADYTGLIVIGALGVAAVMFGPQIMQTIQGAGGSDDSKDKDASQNTDPNATAQDPNASATATSTAGYPGYPGYPNVLAPYPLTIPLVSPLFGFYPFGRGPYPYRRGYPYRPGYPGFVPPWPYLPPFHPIVGHFQAPRWFNHGPRFLGPPVPAPGPHH